MKVEISLKKIKAFFSKIWNYRANKKRERLHGEISAWYTSNVVEAALKREKENKDERLGNGVKTEYYCPQCKETFYDHPSLSEDKNVECDKCIGLEYDKPKRVFDSNYDGITQTRKHEDGFYVIKSFKDGQLIKEVRTPTRNV